jgi:hypothetical protein
VFQFHLLQLSGKGVVWVRHLRPAAYGGLCFTGGRRSSTYALQDLAATIKADSLEAPGGALHALHLMPCFACRVPSTLHGIDASKAFVLCHAARRMPSTRSTLPTRLTHSRRPRCSLFTTS